MQKSFSLTVLLLLFALGLTWAQSDTLEVLDTSAASLVDTTAKKSTKAEIGYLYHMRHETKGKLIYDPEVNEQPIDYYIATGYEVYRVVPKDPDKKGQTMKTILGSVPAIVDLLRVIFGIGKKKGDTGG